MSLIQRCPHFRELEWNREVPLYTEVSSFQGVGIEGFHCIQKHCVLISGGWNRGVPLYTEVSLFQEVGIEEFHCGGISRVLTENITKISWTHCHLLKWELVTDCQL